MKDERRVKKFDVAPELIACMKSGTFRVVQSDAPDDATFVAAGYDAERRYFYVILQHESWPHIPLGEEIPTISPPTIQEVRVPSVNQDRHGNEML